MSSSLLRVKQGLRVPWSLIGDILRNKLHNVLYELHIVQQFAYHDYTASNDFAESCLQNT